MRVLIVENTSRIRERLIKLVAQISGVSGVEGTGKPDETPQLIEKFRPDILVLNLLLPGNYGLNLLKRMENMKIPITTIVYSSYLDANLRETCHELGAHLVFARTTELEAMLGAISGLAAKAVQVSANKDKEV